MTSRHLVVLTVLLLVAVTGWNVAAKALHQQPPAARGLNRMDLIAPTIISGNDLGFRIENNRDNVPVGKLVVRIKGVGFDAQVGRGGVVLIAQ
jgi:hypothetical protein